MISAIVVASAIVFAYSWIGFCVFSINRSVPPDTPWSDVLAGFLWPLVLTFSIVRKIMK